MYNENSGNKHRPKQDCSAKQSRGERLEVKCSDVRSKSEHFGQICSYWDNLIYEDDPERMRNYNDFE